MTLFEDNGAIFSPCRTWRYRLWRIWDPGKPLLTMLMLNPSTADEDANDPTVTRCQERARRGGFGGLVVLNIFAFRATDPDVMKAAADPIGPMNDKHLREGFKAVAAGVASAGKIGEMPPVICCGWGVHGAHRGRHRAVAAMAAEFDVQLHCLVRNADGQPKHPLYVGYSQPFIAWSAT